MQPVSQLILYRIKAQWRAVPNVVKHQITSLAVALTYLLLLPASITGRLESGLLGEWFSLRGSRPVPRSVAVVRIDTATYTRMQIPLDGMLSREFIAETIERIAAGGAKLIVVDLVFLAEGINKEADARLAQALANSPSVIAEGLSVNETADASGTKRSVVEKKVPIKLFATRAKGVLLTQARFEHNDRMERIALSDALMVSSDVHVPLVTPLRQYVSATLKEPAEYDLINYYGEPPSLTGVSLVDVIDSSRGVSSDYFRDRVVFIGTATDGVQGFAENGDRVAVPVSRKPMYGVEVLATIAANVLDQTWLRRLPPGMERFALGLLSWVCTLMILALSMRRSAAFAACAITAWGLASYSAFVWAFYFIPGAMVFAVLLPLVLLAKWLVERRLPRDVFIAKPKSV